MNAVGFTAMKVRVLCRMRSNGASEQKIQMASDKMELNRGSVLSRKPVLSFKQSKPLSCKFGFTSDEKKDILETTSIRLEVSGLRSWEDVVGSL